MWKIAIKDLKVLFYDKKAVMLSFLLPIALITLFALAFGGAGGSSESRPSELLISDMDSSEMTLKLIRELDSLKELEIEVMDSASALQRVREGDSKAVLVFYPGFSDSLNSGSGMPSELFYDQAREMEMGLLQQALMSNMMAIIGKDVIKINVFKSIDKHYPAMNKALRDDIFSYIEGEFAGSEESESEFNMDSGFKMTGIFREEKNNLGLVQAVAGVAVMMLLFSVAGIGAGILQEKEEGTLKRLLYSPLQRESILYGKFIFTVIFSVLQLLVMFVFAWLVFGLDLFIDPLSLLIMIITTAFACASFGIFLASISSSRKQVESLSTIVILVMSAIGGSMMPIFIMPEFMQKMAVASVNYWSIDGFYDIFWRELPLSKVLVNATILTGIGLVMTALSVQLFRKNILKLA